MDHAAQMAAARELRASFSGQTSKAPRQPGGRGGGRSVYASSTAPRYPQPAVGRHAMSQPRHAIGTGISVPVGGSGRSAQTVPPHLRPTAGQNTKQTSGVSQSHQGSGSGAANSSRETPPHLREPVGNAPQQSAGFPQNAPPHLRTPAGSSTQQPAGSGGSGEGQNSGAKPQAGNHHAAAAPPHLRAPADSSTQQPAGTRGPGEGQSSGAKSQTGNDQPTGNSQAVANPFGGLQNSRFVPNTRPSQSTPLTQTIILKDTEMAKQTVSADNVDSQPVVSQSTGQHICGSAEDTLPPHLRQPAHGPARQPCGTGTAGGTQGGSAFFNFNTGGTQTNDVFTFQAGNTHAAAGRPVELQNSQSKKDAQPLTSSALEATKTTAPRDNSAVNAGSHAPIDHLPDAASSQPVRGRGGLKDSRFASTAQLSGSADPFAHLLTMSNTATKKYDNHFGGTTSGVKSHDGQQSHVSKYTTLPTTAKEAPAFVPAATKPAMAPLTTRPSLMTPEPDDKGDDFSTDVEMVDAGKDAMVGSTTKYTYGGVRQSRWVPRAGPDTNALQADGYRVSSGNTTKLSQG